MAVVIRLQRTGKPKQAYFRIVAIEKSRGASGKPLEVLGSYDPRVESPSKKIQLRKERFEHWLKNGALASETMVHLVKASEGLRAKAQPPEKNDK
jgi:small subunit ribosomal protein S16